MKQSARRSPHSGSPIATRRGGFTLIELMVVLLLISLFSALIIPSVVSATRQDTVRTQGDKLADLLRFASLSAITRHSPVAVRFNEDRGICLVTVSNPEAPWQEVERPEMQVLATLKLPARVRLDLNLPQAEEAAQNVTQHEVTFLSDGRANDAVIALTDTSAERCAVEIFGATGEIRVREEEP